MIVLHFNHPDLKVTPSGTARIKEYLAQEIKNISAVYEKGCTSIYELSRDDMQRKLYHD
jgi:hypothetical protein